jgi:hypothetical protein
MDTQLTPMLACNNTENIHTVTLAPETTVGSQGPYPLPTVLRITSSWRSVDSSTDGFSDAWTRSFDQSSLQSSGDCSITSDSGVASYTTESCLKVSATHVDDDEDEVHVLRPWLTNAGLPTGEGKPTGRESEPNDAGARIQTSRDVGPLQMECSELTLSCSFDLHSSRMQQVDCLGFFLGGYQSCALSAPDVCGGVTGTSTD